MYFCDIDIHVIAARCKRHFLECDSNNVIVRIILIILSTR